MDTDTSGERSTSEYWPDYADNSITVMTAVVSERL
jgi:hypothetical protein